MAGKASAVKRQWARLAKGSGFPIVAGAGAGTRTRMANRPRDFKSLASTSSATPAFQLCAAKELAVHCAEGKVAGNRPPTQPAA